MSPSSPTNPPIAASPSSSPGGAPAAAAVPPPADAEKTEAATPAADNSLIGEPRTLQATTPTVHGPEAAAPRVGGASTRPSVAETRPQSSELESGDGDVDDFERRILKSLEAEEQGPRLVKDPFIGRTVAGRYNIVSKVGTGGMGAVYKASQAGMDRFVAIKVLLSEFNNNPALVKRFHMEALAVSKLDHPHTIRIYDFGQTEDKTLFIAMEFLAGRSLKHELRARRVFPVRRALRVAAQICDSLFEAHNKGIVHRDLKPDNVFLIPVGEDPDFVKVLDFGVARLKVQDQRLGTLTQTGMVFGTPKYMSPEQCRSPAVDHLTDIYAVGIMLFEMLTGNTPFQGENPLSLLLAHVQEALPAFAEVRPDLVIPEPVEQIVRQALDKNPARRFQTAAQMRLALLDAEKAVEPKFEAVVRRSPEDMALIADTTKAVTASSVSAQSLEQALNTEAVAAVSGAEPATVVGDVLAMPEAPPRRRGRRIAFGVAAGFVVLAGAAALTLYLALPRLPADLHTLVRQPAAEPAPLAPLPLATVELVLDSTPPGAEVFAADQPIGRAPLRLTRLREEGTKTAYRFRLTGHRDANLEVPMSAPGKYVATLEPEAAPPGPGPTVGPTEAAPGDPKPLGGKPGGSKTPGGKPPGFEKVPELKPFEKVPELKPFEKVPDLKRL